MTTSRAWLFLLLTCSLHTSACSLVKLSDDISQAHCKKDTDCELLNDRTAKDFDPCELWQCSDSSKYCEFSALDQDHDGFTPHTVTVKGEELVCQAATAKQDCDDANAARTPGGKERCDNIDNDCDQNVDEGVLEPHVASSLTFTGATAAGIGNVSSAVDAASGKIGLAYSVNNDSPAVGFSVLDNDLPSGVNAAIVKLPRKTNGLPAEDLFADGVGVAALGQGKFAIAFYDINGGKRMVAGRVDTSSGTILAVTPAILGKGLHCAAGEPCGTGTLATRPPALAALGDAVLVSYVRAAADPGLTCALKADTVPAAPLLANLLTQTPDGLAELTSRAVVLGKTSSLAPPALVAIPDPATGSGFGFLEGFVDDAGAIQLVQVQAQGSSLVVSAPLATLADDKARYSGVRMVLGPKTDAGQLIGVSFQRDCKLTARVGVALLRASVKASGAPLLEVVTPATLVGGAPNEKDAMLAYSKDRDSWAAVYRDSMGLRARVLDAKGTALGDAPYTLIDGSASAMTQVYQTAGVVPTLATGGWFGALAYTEHTGGNPLALSAATLAGCAAAN